MRSMKEVVAEYNSLAIDKVERFSSVEAGEKRIAKLKEQQASVKPKEGSIGAELAAITPIVSKKENFMMRITVDGQPYRSVKVAFEELGLPLAKHIRFRSKLHAERQATFDGHVFKMIRKDELPL